MIVVNQHILIPESEMRLSFARSSGPGGQNVNKVNSKVTLHWPVTSSPSLPDDVRERFVAKFANRINSAGELVLTSQESRDQPSNVADVYEKLRTMVISVAQAPRRRKATRPTKGSKVRRLKSKRDRSQTKQLRGKVSRDD
jgi:ribosome-associated protein